METGLRENKENQLCLSASLIASPAKVRKAKHFVSFAGKYIDFFKLAFVLFFCTFQILQKKLIFCKYFKCNDCKIKLAGVMKGLHVSHFFFPHC